MIRAAVFVLLASTPLLADRAVTLDGNILEKGGYDKAANEYVVGKGKSEKRHPAAMFALIETIDGDHLYSVDIATRLRGYRDLASRERLKRLVAVLDTAYKSLDKRLVREVFERAQRNGFDGKKAEKFKRRLEKLEKKELRTGPNEGKVKKVRGVLAEIESVYTDLLAQRVQVGIERDTEASLELLRELLIREPDHARANRILGKMADKKFTLGGPRLWLDWHLDMEPTSARLTKKSRDLSRFQATWRRDLFEVDAGPIRLFTPVKDTAVLARCLAWGELTCRALEEIFQTDKPFQRASSGLAILLYENRKEYLTTTGTGSRGADLQFLKWTGGYYSSADQLSRFFWQKGRDAERRIASTFVHELTHHWIAELCPRFADSHRRRSGSVPGTWIVEGFATLMEEGRFDLEHGTWNLFDSRAKSLDTVQALVGTGHLIEWKRLLTMSKRHQMTLSHKAGLEFVGRWSMGTRKLSLARLYYEQSAAVCHFLYHAENGKYRTRLGEYVIDYYTGKRERLGTMAAFGLTEAHLGMRVEQFSKDVAGGWRPRTPATPEPASPPK